MGCCISKCKPNKHYSLDDYSHHIVHDKLVISQQALKNPKITPIINPSSPSSNKIFHSPPSPTSSSTSISSSVCTNNASSTSGISTVSSCSSLSSGFASILASKDRSFSNEFLRQCVKENPHVIRINSIKEHSQLLVPSNVHVQKWDSQSIPVLKQSNIPPKIIASTSQKRARSNSPALINRQKSFRKESERFNSLQCRTLRSPSPSRRFNNGDGGRGILASTCKESCSKRMLSNLKVNSTNTNSFSSSLRNENSNEPVSPYIINSSHHNHHVHSNCLKKNTNRETCIHRISSKIDEVAVEEALAQHESEAKIPMEDINNPLISLDCFIFI